MTTDLSIIQIAYELSIEVGGVTLQTSLISASHRHPAADISDASPVGLAVLTAADSAAARTALGVGTGGGGGGGADGIDSAWTVPPTKPSSAALVASMQARRSEGVPLRSMLGSGSGAGFYDLTSSINADLAGLFSEGGLIVDDTAARLVLHEGLKLVNGFRWKGNTRLLRAFAATSIAQPLIAQDDLTQPVSDVLIDGLILDLLAEDFSAIGTCLSFNLTRARLRNLILRTQNNGGGAGHGMLIRGTDIEVSGCRHSVAAGTGTGSMSFKVVFGSKIRVLNCVSFPADDCFGVVANTDPAAVTPNAGASDVLFQGCYGETNAKLCVIGASSNPAGQNSTYTGVLDGITFQSILGFGRYAAMQMDIDNIAPGYRALDNVLVEDIGSPGLPAGTQNGINITGQHIGSIGRVTLRDNDRRNPQRKRALKVNAPGIDLVIDRAHLMASYNSISILRPQGSITLRGGSVLEAVPGAAAAGDDDQSGEDAMRAPIQVSAWRAFPFSADVAPTGRLRLDLGSDTQVLGVATPLIGGVPTPMPAVNIMSPNVDLVWMGGVAAPYAGATGNALVNAVAGATAILGDISSSLTGSPDVTGSATVKRLTADMLAGKQDTSAKGAANGYAGLDGTGKVPASQLPSFVDDVIEGATLSGFPTTGETGKIYVTLDTNKTWRWSGSTYVEISPSPGSTDGVAEGSTNQYFTEGRVRSTLLTSYAAAASRTALAAGDSVVGAFGKIGKWLGDLSAVAFSGAWSDLTGRPTTVGAAGLTDAVTTTGAQTIAGKKSFSSEIGLIALGSDPASPVNGDHWLGPDGRFRFREGGITFPLLGRSGAMQLLPVSGELLYNCTGGFVLGPDYTIYNTGHVQGPMNVPADVTVTEISINVATAGPASSVAKVTIYDSDPVTGLPRNLIYTSADMNVTTPGAKVVNGLSVALKAGRHWLGIRASTSGSIAFTAWDRSVTPSIPGGTSLSGSGRNSISRSATYASATQSPWVWSASDVSGGNVPMITLKV